jgi:hypothetical protein
MFERNRVDNTQEKTGTAAVVELTDGRRITGRFLVARPKTLIEVLNGPCQFLEFEPYDGEAEVIAKASIKSLRMIAAPTGRHPSTLIKDTDNFKPYEILGLERGASRADVRAAFHKRSKSYHPDRYSNADLPAEVMSYLEAMARRINAAYEVLSEETAKAERFAAQRTQPIFQSGPTA